MGRDRKKACGTVFTLKTAQHTRNMTCCTSERTQKINMDDPSRHERARMIFCVRSEVQQVIFLVCCAVLRMNTVPLAFFLSRPTPLQRAWLPLLHGTVPVISQMVGVCRGVATIFSYPLLLTASHGVAL